MTYSQRRPPIDSQEHRDWVIYCCRLASKRLQIPLERLKRRDVLTRARVPQDYHWPSWSDVMAFPGGWMDVRNILLSTPEPLPEPVTRDLPLPQTYARIEATEPEPPALPEAPAPVAETPADPLEVRRWKQRFLDLQKEHESVLKRLDLAERMREHLSAVSMEGTPLGVQAREKASGRREATAVALASDWHVEEIVEPAKVNDLNAYDLSISERSAHRFFEGIIWLLENHSQTFEIRDLVLWMGGDLVTGHIHEDNIESTAFAPLLATRFVRSLWVQGIRMLLQETDLEQIIVPCSRGNHGRTSQKPRIATGAEHSYEQALYYQLADDFAKEPRVRFSVAPGELLYLDVYDRRIRFTHGDAVNYGGGVGGITIPINKAVSQWDGSKRADLTCMGHWHQYQAARRVVVNGSLIGYSPYSVRIKADFEPPQQAFFLMDSRRGMCQSTPIWVREDDHVVKLDPTASEVIRRRIISGEQIKL